MILMLTGFILLASSIGLHLREGLLPHNVQLAAKLLCVFCSILILFKPRQAGNSLRPHAKSMIVGFSVLVPLVVTGLVYNRLIAPFLLRDNQLDGLYSFLLWGTLALATMPLWGFALQMMNLIPRNDENPFQTWR